MGEARRRRAHELANRPALDAVLELARARQAESEEIASEDQGDRADREAHGFTYDDDWTDGTLLCRNGCGLSYPKVVAGKIRQCRGA